MDKYIFKSSGNYLGFITNNFIFSRDGVYLGWVDENKYVWDTSGRYKGGLSTIGEYEYIVRHQYTMSPVPRAPKITPPTPAIPPPVPNIPPINLQIGFEDGF